MNLEESLRALETDDEVRVPPRVDAAVMAAWDAHRAGPPAQALRWPLWVAACAGVVIVVVAIAARPGQAPVALPPSGGTAQPSNALIQQELVLVPEVEPGPLMLMRVRMTRREFSRLGVPISNPQGDGLVDVEVLVGEDGVARSIRRAVAVNWTRPNR
jgi:hypothetical protein